MSAPVYKSFEQSLTEFENIAADVAPISNKELQSRIAKLQGLMMEAGVKAVYLDTSTSLTYFTGMTLGASERLHGAIIPSKGAPIYISPAFEEPKTVTLIKIEGEIATWEEHEDPALLVANRICDLPAEGNVLAFDPATPFMFSSPITAHIGARLKVIGAGDLIAQCRQIKSATEIAIIQTAMTASLRVHKAVWEGLYEGVSTTEVTDFIAAAHQKLGMRHVFAAAQFGEATAYPHGVPYAQTLTKGDMVLIDLGAHIHRYCSDITRTYVFGEATERQRELWNMEKAAHRAAFEAARLGSPCEDVDAAARKVLTDAGYGPDYQVPGLPHRTGHGLGMDLHETPFIVRGNKTKLQPGMVFSDEPMLCVYGECGVRLEDIIYMSDKGPVFFTEPAHSIEKPFG
ncbi:M24 family metallopeptidase [Aliirhizobium cellulosilyticum]|uniref:Xaa-Pro dipeptidase n=1 Tax=Aliirhizobium cellulosilyticum TaxID=393664 RepID=A0A7W6V0P6_9HYPH|nr:Xaa-Pro peptidase family protein [Rhizobium cellulosilyticum]MBB4350073.1 Xaa-Pro dipeptidase [Rhizobium cellulosilyticum]MBB4413252.1 Xaa-Pro dipeptidase [Rhizobium cellulosilyticum]MBB4447810.1 Xaa-Pro dipeptidase [Rhizobium cellulosilyticum]